jgi:APA family basic amino acid/polyamine antiporter
MSKQLFLKKSIRSLLNEAAANKGGLKKSLNAWSLTALGIGAIIGAGIFVLSGQAAALYAGPGIAISFILAAFICVFAALCYAEFASLIPIAGSAYSYAYVTMGELIAWIIGWVLTLEYLFSASTVAVGWSGYFTSIMADLGLSLPFNMVTAPLSYHIEQGWALTGSFLNLPAMLITLFMGILITLGVKAAASFNNVMVVIKLLVIVLFITLGCFFIQKENWIPFIPQNTGVFGHFGLSGVFRGAGLVFFAFIGFDALSTLAQEAKNPQKDLPRGMLGSLSVSTLVYILVALVLTGIVSYTQLDVADPIAVAINALGPKFLWVRFVIKLAILAGLTSVVLVMLMGQSRIFFTMAQDGLLPKVFTKVHNVYRTPYVITACITVLAMLVAGLFPVEILGQLVSMGTLLAFAIVCFGVLVLRAKQPLLHRPFKTPFVPWIPLAGTLACVLQMFMLPAVTWIQLLIWMALGLWIYFSYSIHNSLLRKSLKKKK